MVNYTVSNIQANHSIVAEFGQLELIISAHNNAVGKVTARYKIGSGSWQTISSVSTSGTSITVPVNSAVTIEANANTGYRWAANANVFVVELPESGTDENVPTTSATTSFQDVVDHMVEDMEYIIQAPTSVPQYTITPSAGSGGTITPNTPQTVYQGDSVTFQVTPNTGYRIKSVKLDGSPMQPDS